MTGIFNHTPVTAERMDGEVIRVGDVHVRVKVTGEGPPLLLVHGLGASLELWQPLIDQLSGYQVITLDNPGAGASTVPSPPWRMPKYAQVLDLLLEELGYDQVDVLGLSFGGMICQELALRYPERIRKLILAGTSAGWGSLLGSPLALSILATPLRYYSPAYMAAVAPFLYGGEADGGSELVKAQTEARMKAPPSIPGYFAQMTTAMTWTSVPFLPALKVPTLVLAGASDPITPPYTCYQIASLIPGAEYAEIKRGGHLFLIEKPATSAAVITEFLQRESVTHAA